MFDMQYMPSGVSNSVINEAEDKWIIIAYHNYHNQQNEYLSNFQYIYSKTDMCKAKDISLMRLNACKNKLLKGSITMVEFKKVSQNQFLFIKKKKNYKM